VKKKKKQKGRRRQVIRTNLKKIEGNKEEGQKIECKRKRKV
jgi:hypothetical protein